MKKNSKSIYWVEPERSCFPHCIIDGFISYLIRDRKYNLNFLYVVKQNKKEDYFVHEGIKNVTKRIKTSWDLRKVISSDILIIDGYRLSDKLLTYLRNKSNLKTIYLQHGRYTDIKHNLISKHYISKLINYSFLIFLSLFNYPFNTLNFILRIVYQKKKLLVDFGFLYTPKSYWLKQHKQKGYEFRSFKIIQDRDNSRFKLVPNSRNSFLYCAQSIFEDGRTSEKEIFQFSEELTKISCRLKLDIDIKLHPRSEINLINKYFQKCNIVDDLLIPKPKFVITHSSGIARFFADNSIIVFCMPINDEVLPQGLLNYPNIYHVKIGSNIEEILKIHKNSFAQQEGQNLDTKLFLESLNLIL